MSRRLTLGLLADYPYLMPAPPCEPGSWDDTEDDWDEDVDVPDDPFWEDE